MFHLRSDFGLLSQLGKKIKLTFSLDTTYKALISLAPPVCRLRPKTELTNDNAGLVRLSKLEYNLRVEFLLSDYKMELIFYI